MSLSDLNSDAPAFSPSSRSTSTDKLKSNQKWSKLRNTVQTVGAFSRSSQRKREVLEEQNTFLKKFSTRQLSHYADGAEAQNDVDPLTPVVAKKSAKEELKKAMRKSLAITPEGRTSLVWLGVVAVAILYNLWTCIAREAFREIQTICNGLWIATDFLWDLVYLVDVLVQFRTGYLEHGLYVFDARSIARRYVHSKEFIIDLLSLTPLDLLQIYLGVHPLIRFPRFLKVYRFLQFMDAVETRTAFPNLWRVANLAHIIFLGCHWFAAFYYLLSEAQGFDSSWGYQLGVNGSGTLTQKYLHSLYWSTLTLTTIGDLPPPEKNLEFVFTISSYLIGVFVFATIVGQVGSVITNHNAKRQEFEKYLDEAKSFMRYHKIPFELQKRVQRWYAYAWSRGRIMGGGGDLISINLLPDKLKTELAIHINLDTLRKVTIFNDCEPEFLHDLVLKMKTFIYTPGDMICKKGEVAREMYIIADGIIEVISDTGEVLKKMQAGDFFGEIGILNIGGGINRRTADVKSVGYSELFVLSKYDLLSALSDHPEAEKLIKEYGQRRLLELSEHKKKFELRNSSQDLNKLINVVNAAKSKFLTRRKTVANEKENTADDNEKQITSHESCINLHKRPSAVTLGVPRAASSVFSSSASRLEVPGQQPLLAKPVEFLSESTIYDKDGEPAGERSTGNRLVSSRSTLLERDDSVTGVVDPAVLSRELADLIVNFINEKWVPNEIAVQRQRISQLIEDNKRKSKMLEKLEPAIKALGSQDLNRRSRY